MFGVNKEELEDSHKYHLQLLEVSFPAQLHNHKSRKQLIEYNFLLEVLIGDFIYYWSMSQSLCVLLRKMCFISIELMLGI